MLDGLFKRFKFSSHVPSNSVQQDKKMLDINVGPVYKVMLKEARIPTIVNVPVNSTAVI